MIHKILSLFLFASILFMMSCNSTKKVVQTTPTGPKPTVTKEFTISQGACFGRCPVYDVTLMSDSTLKLVGKNFMNYIGNYEMKLNAENYTSLHELYKKIKQDTFQDRYSSDIVDLASVTYYFFDDYNIMKKKVVTQGIYPEPLQNLATEARKYINSMNWIKDVTADTVNPDELIVQMKAGKKIDLIIDEHYRYKLFLKEALGKDSNIYLIGFDKTTIEQSQLLNLLKNNPNVMFVEKNNKVELRSR